MRHVDWIDISVPIHEGMPHWPTEPPVRMERSTERSEGLEITVTRLSMSAHTGTHIDAPLHFISGGTPVDDLPWDAVIGPARVLEILHPRAVHAEELGPLGIQPGERILFKTRNSQRPWYQSPFEREFVHLTEEAAGVLVQSRILSVGIDYLSVGKFDNGAETHRLFLEGGIWIVEGLFLGHVEAGEYDLICLPLRLAGAEGAPARALLRPRSPVPGDNMPVGREVKT